MQLTSEARTMLSGEIGQNQYTHIYIREVRRIATRRPSGTVSNESHDGFAAVVSMCACGLRSLAGRHSTCRVVRRLRAAVVGAWWAMSRAEKGQRKTIEACERIAPADAAGAGNTGESHRPAKRASGNAVRRP